MSASLVGSEMCIRDSLSPRPCRWRARRGRRRAAAGGARERRRQGGRRLAQLPARDRGHCSL
eukprot:10511603-Alexandrium_andersonii.AAC.1